MALQTQALGAALHARRLNVGLSREALGQRAGGISSSTVRRVEDGVVVPHPATVAALDRALANAERAAKRDAAKRESGQNDLSG
jgi:predicted transcriptional regulator